MAAISLTVAFYESLTLPRWKDRPSNLAFTLTCIGVAVYDLACGGQYNVDTTLQSLPWLKLQVAVLNLTGFCLVWYFSQETRKIPRILLVVFGVWFGLGALAQALNLGDLTWIVSHPIEKLRVLPFGLSVVYREVDTGILTDVQNAAGMVTILYVLTVVIRYARSGHRREARPCSSSLASCAHPT